MLKLKELISDIRFWIFLFFLIRLYGITLPPLEVAHNWRQTTVTMVARNFIEVDNNIFYPRIDIAGEKTGITGMEFPLLNYLIYLVSLLFGYEHWYGRLINLIVSSFGIFFFFKVVKKYFDHRIAFSSTMVLLVSIWFSYSRKIMPDTFAMSFIITGIYYGSNYLDKELKSKGLKDLLLYSLLILAGILSKLPSAYLLIVLIIPLAGKHIGIKRKIIFLVSNLVIAIPISIWYFYWVPYLVEYYGFWHFFMGKSLLQGLNEIAENITQSLQKFYDVALKFIGFAMFLLGLVYTFIKKEKLLQNILLLSFLGFLVIILKAGFNFPHHTYYIIPFVPVMSLVAGYGLSQIKNQKIFIIILIAICSEGILNQQHDFRIRDREKPILNLEKDFDTFSEKEDLILINSGQFPTPMYFAHRKGWVDYNEKILDKNYIKSLQEKGLKYIIILKKTFGTEVKLDYEIILDNEDYCIYKI